MIVIADTTPLNYLVLINQSDLLPHLYGRVLISQSVYEELQNEGTPVVVRTWAANHPAWLEVRSAHLPTIVGLEDLDLGEQEAISLALELKADLLILDDKDARIEASRRSLIAIGTLRVLEDAAVLGLVDLPQALARLQQTTFRASANLLRAMLDRDAERKRKQRP